MSMRSRTPAAEIERLRRFRGPKTPDLTLGPILGAMEKNLKKQRGALDKLGIAWTEVVPTNLASNAQPERLAGGVLSIRCPDSAARHAFDLWLRSGGDLTIKQRVRVTVKRIKLV